MVAASADVPAIQLLAGPDASDVYRGERLGACTIAALGPNTVRGGSPAEIADWRQLATTAGTCASGTASPMAAVAEGSA